VRLLCILAAVVVSVVGCSGERSPEVEEEPGMVLQMNWQRLVTEEGETCERCGITQDEFRQAVGLLRESLRPLGIELEASETSLTPDEFKGDVVASNRVLISDRTLEEWLGGETGLSTCESCCSAVGDNVQCRTVTIGGTTYEAVPADLIVRAGLAAASELLRGSDSSPCCPPSVGTTQSSSPCCPSADADESATG
jgi:hypothetical protein